MVAFTYIAKRSDGEWKATRISAEEPELSAEASSTYVLQQTLKKLSIENSDGGSVATLFSTINEDTVIFQVNVGGAVFASGGGGGGGAAAAAAGDAAEAEEKKEEKPAEEEEEEDDDMGFSLFD